MLLKIRRCAHHAGGHATLHCRCLLDPVDSGRKTAQVVAEVGGGGLTAMPRVLVIEDDSLICEMVADCFRSELGAEVVCTLTGPDGARLIMGYEFDLAVIDAVLPDVSGFALAQLAANENLPVLMTSGHPLLSDQLVRFNFPHLRKPFDLNALIEEARTIINGTRQNIRRVQHSAATMRAHLKALEIALKEAHRLMAESKTFVELDALVGNRNSGLPFEGDPRMFQLMA
jgi:DNA-binding response OmpR family regulator